VSQHIDPQVIRRTNGVLTAGTWFLIVGVVAYSLMTTTPLVADHTAPGWEKSAFLLGLMVDAAFVMALQADSVLARYGASEPGPWPRRFRFFTGGASVFLNIWHAVEARDWVGVAIHVIAPALLLIVAEVGPVYRRAMAEALTRAEVDAPAAGGQIDVPAPVSTLAPAEATPQVGPVEEPVSTPVAEVPEVDAEERPKLSAKEARKVIEEGWTTGQTIEATAHKATRSTSWVGRIYKELDEERGPRPVRGQLALV